jgi:acetylornithine deacetylase/succinyl-diaminopimelate desuccinylase-like protein
MNPATADVAAHARSRFEATVERLRDYVSYPAISCDPDHALDVRRLAQRVRDDLEQLGLDRARVLEVPGALPIVAAEWMKAGADRPTILVYGHLDLQPVKGESWHTPPHDAVRRDGRLYARGASDDMGGWVSHFAAIEAWFAQAGTLPCNLKLIIEGEEEIGSPNLESYMNTHPDVFAADAMILTDCENPSTTTPGLTVSLRGLLEVELTCEALSADVHSGLWGGMVPDVSLALIKLIARLADDDGRMQIARVPIAESRRAAARAVPLDSATIRDGAHLLDGVNPLPERGIPAAEWMWWQPSVTVVATTLPTLDRKKNALRQKASAILSVRLAPGQTPAVMVAELRKALLTDVPAGVKATLAERGHPSEGWLYEPKGPAFAAADRAYEASWGTKLVQVGVGGSIPFVALFGKRYADLPLILNGVMDPRSTAHGPDESLDLGVFEKAIVANVHLYDELGALGKTGIKG